MANGIPARVGGNGINGVGYQRHLRGFYLFHQLNKPLVGVAFDVELRRDHFFQVQHVLVADVAFVGPGVNGDALRPEAFAVERDPD